MGQVRTPAAVLWDMDGTLVDTEPYWIEAEFDLASTHGGVWTREHALTVVGSDLLDSARYIRRHAGVPLSPAEIVEELMNRVAARIGDGVPWRPGARELLQSLAEQDIPCALVTMSYRRLVEPILEHLEPGTFAAVVTGDRVAHGKPHPEPYLEAARRLGVRPQDTVAIEDSDTGSRSAEAAGCTTLVVPNHVAVPERPTHVQLPSLVGLEARDLGLLLSGVTPAFD